MAAILIRRLATALPTLLAIILLSFVLMRLAPGGPFDARAPARSGDPRDARPPPMASTSRCPNRRPLSRPGCCTAISARRWSISDFTVGALIAQGLPVSLDAGRPGAGAGRHAGNRRRDTGRNPCRRPDRSGDHGRRDPADRGAELRHRPRAGAGVRALARMAAGFGPGQRPDRWCCRWSRSRFPPPARSPAWRARGWPWRWRRIMSAPPARAASRPARS